MTKNEVLVRYRNSVLQDVKKNLERRGFYAQIMADTDAVLTYLAEKIPPQCSVGLGGSLTLRELGIDGFLQRRGNPLFDHWQPKLTKEQVLRLRRQQLQADFFLSSANALTRDGRIVNADGVGNRVAAMIFGPGEVILFIGFAKVVFDLDEAWQRIRQVAAPQNALRLGLATPCAKTGQCQECAEPVSICRVFTVMEYRPSATPCTVILLPQDLGL